MKHIIKPRFYKREREERHGVRHPDGNMGKRDDRNSHGFWAGVLADHDAFAMNVLHTHKWRERERKMSGSIRRLLDKQDKAVCTWWTTTSSPNY